MTLKDLIERTGIEPRMVRYLITQGLVPRALATGLGSDPYDLEHVEAIERVQAMLRLGYKIPTIKRLLDRRDAFSIAETEAVELRLKSGIDPTTIDLDSTIEALREQLAAFLASRSR